MPINKVVFGDQTLIDLTDSTVTAGDLREGVVAYDRSGKRIVGDTSWELSINGGAKVEQIAGTEDDYLLIQSVGMTNVVIGSFIAGSEGTVQSVSIPYVGNGYPISAIIYPKDGAYKLNYFPWNASTKRYAVGLWTMVKGQVALTPTYATSGEQNIGAVMFTYKNSTTNSDSYGRSGNVYCNTYTSLNAESSGHLCCRFKSNTELSVFIASDSYGLLSGLEYTYQIIYSE